MNTSSTPTTPEYQERIRRFNGMRLLTEYRTSPEVKEAIYNRTNHTLSYWNSRNTVLVIDCRSLKCARLTMLAVKHITGVNQSLKLL